MISTIYAIGAAITMAVLLRQFFKFNHTIIIADLVWLVVWLAIWSITLIMIVSVSDIGDVVVWKRKDQKEEE